MRIKASCGSRIAAQGPGSVADRAVTYVVRRQATEPLVTDPHVTIEPSILYLGTPGILISTQNADGTANLAPMSSAWWLGWRCMLGLQTASQTPQNMIRTGQCVLNLPSPKQADAVNRLARLTGTETIPELKRRLGYAYEPSKFEVAGLTPIASQTVAAPRALE